MLSASSLFLCCMPVHTAHQKLTWILLSLLSLQYFTHSTTHYCIFTAVLLFGIMNKRNWSEARMCMFFLFFADSSGQELAYIIIRPISVHYDSFIVLSIWNSCPFLITKCVPSFNHLTQTDSLRLKKNVQDVSEQFKPPCEMPLLQI